MVYYPPLPLVVKTETTKQQQSCSPLSNETQIYSTNSTIAINQQLQHHNQLSINSNTNHCVSKLSAPLDDVSQSQSYLRNIKLKYHRQHQFQEQDLPVEITNNSPNCSIIGSVSSHHFKLQFKCEQCNMIFGSKGAHTSHMKSHSKQNNNESKNHQHQSVANGIVTIGQVISTSNTDRPISTVAGSDPYQCNVCKKTFSVPARLIRHYRTHTGERPFECEFCHKKFSVKENLQVHRRVHTKERPYKCDVCGRAFEHSGKLHRHMRIHTGERPHKCSVCSKTFIQSGQLVIHMRTHTGEKPYKCPVEGCGKGFTCSKQLKVHSRTHTGEKPYHCDICFRDFGYNHVLKLHRVQHYGSKCYKCTICDETFKSKKEMEAHIKGHANEVQDDEYDQTASAAATSQGTQNNGKNLMQENETRYSKDIAPVDIIERSNSTSPTSPSIVTSLPLSSKMSDGRVVEASIIESSSKGTSENGDNSLYKVYQRFEHSGITFSIQQSNNNNCGSINPALLAAASLASCKVEENSKSVEISSSRALSLVTMDTVESDSNETHHSINELYKQQSSANSNEAITLSTIGLSLKHNLPTSSSSSSTSSPSSSLVYEPQEVLRQHGYYAPAPVPEFMPSIRAANDIVRRVEAAIACAEPLLTPPRLSSIESPERSSSPESDSMMMADRDVMTLPLRKRKLYLNDNQAKDVSPVMRMNSVIQFAKAS